METSAKSSEPAFDKSAAGTARLKKSNKALAIFEAKSKEESSSRTAPASKMDRIQHWVNDISESAARTSPESETAAHVVKKFSGPPKVKKKYTTSGRRTSSMSGMDIKQKSVDLKKLPQPADLRVPIGNKNKLKNTESLKIISQEEIKEENEEWTLVKLQNGIESDSSSYEIVDAAEEIEQVQLFMLCFTFLYFVNLIIKVNLYRLYDHF